MYHKLQTNPYGKFLEVWNLLSRRFQNPPFLPKLTSSKKVPTIPLHPNQLKTNCKE